MNLNLLSKKEILNYFKRMLINLCFILLFINKCIGQQTANEDSPESNEQIELNYVKYNTIEGKIFFPYELPFSSNWITESRIVVNYGTHFGFIK